MSWEARRSDTTGPATEGISWIKGRRNFSETCFRWGFMILYWPRDGSVNKVYKDGRFEDLAPGMEKIFPQDTN